MPLYKRFFEISFDLMCVVGPTHFVDVNGAFVSKLGYPKDELLATPFLDLIHPDDVERTGAAGAEFRRTGVWPEGFENRYLTKTGDTIWLRWRVHPDRDNALLHAVAQDVTGKKVIENQLGKYLINLRRAKEEAEALAYAASHDLQEPLRTISTWAGFLSDDFGSALPQEANEQIQYIITAAKRGRELVNDLLRLSRVGRSANFGWVDMNEVVDRTVLDLEFPVRESGAVITRDELPRVWGDVSTLRVLMSNLLSNAVKFSKPGKSPSVHVGAETRSDDWGFWVKDDGIGIDPAYSQLVFRVFKRLDQSLPGTGIGLAICEKIVTLHDGKIWIESVPGEGATVHFTVSRPTGTPHDDESHRHPFGGRSPARREGPGEGDAQDDVNAVSSSSRIRRFGSPALLASGGTLRDRPSRGPSVARSEPPPSLRIRGARRSKE